MPAADRLIDDGIALDLAGDSAGAEARFEAALAADPGSAYASYNLGRLLYRRGERGRAAQLMRAAIERKPDFAEARVVLASVLDEEGRTSDAVTALEPALRWQRDSIGMWLNHAGFLWKLGRLDEAVDSYREVLRLSPGSLDMQIALGIALRQLGRHDEATACFEAARALTPDSADGWYRLAYAFRDADRREEGLACLQKALALDPEHAEARWALAMQQLPAVFGFGEEPGQMRAEFARELDRLARWFQGARIAKGFAAVGTVQPFLLTYQEEDNRELLRRHGELCASLMSAWSERERIPPPPGDRGATGPLRVGVVSSFFSSHSVWNAIVKGWFRHLDPNRFALQAFYLRSPEDDETRFAKSRAAHFESGPRDQRSWVEAIQRQRPDVLLYPEVGMDETTLKLASLRLAPVQAAAWGHPETTGLPTIDYYLSAADFEPRGAAAYYTERLVALPHLGCAYADSGITASPLDLGKWGLDRARGLLVCPGVPFKYAPQHDTLLVEIARRAERCRLVFFTFGANPNLSRKLEGRLRAAFGLAGLPFDDCVTFLPWLNGAEFSGLLARADVFLDTLGFSGFNTAMRAVEAELPIATREGTFMRGRLASGILRRMGLADLVAASDADYVSRAVRLATDAGHRAEVRGRMRHARPALSGDLAPIRGLEEFLAGAARR